MEIMQHAGEFYEMYKNFQAGHPHLGSMLTAEVVYLTGDLASQLISDRKVDTRKLKYTAALAPIYGLTLEGLMETGEIVGRHICDNALAKAALGPNLFGNLFNTFFFVNNTVGERKDYSVPELAKHYANLLSSDESENKEIPSNLSRISNRHSLTKSDTIKGNVYKRIGGRWNNFKRNYIHNIPGKEFLIAAAATLTLWNGFQYWNYEYVDPEMRVSTTLGTALIWTTFLSLWSLKGRRKIVERGFEERVINI